MNTYRLYCVDRTGKIVAAEWLAASDDDEALRLARALNRDSSCELWKRDKFVAAIPLMTTADELSLRLPGTRNQ